MTTARGSKEAASGLASIIIANFNGAPFLEDCLRSACRQSFQEIEVIVVDDASTDASVEIVTRLMTCDPRIRLLTSERNGGPGAARNKALAVASGEWIAVLDNDDMLHPDRLARLIEAAERDGADIAADDLLIFDHRQQEAPQTLLRGRWAHAPFWLDIETFVRKNHLFGPPPILGYLKPIFRSSLLRKAGAVYNERLKVAEDFDFLLKLLRAGGRARVYPEISYFYRKHGASISHRLTDNVIRLMKTADEDMRADIGTTDTKLVRALNARTGSIDTALAFHKLVNAIKGRDLAKIAGILMGAPQSILLLRLPIGVRLRKLWRRRSPSASGRRQICILARQRVVGTTNGSSTYLLSLVEALASRDVDVHFLSPSPTTLGRWPYLSLCKEMNAFRTVRVRGTVRIGRRLFAISPRTYWLGLVAVFERVMLQIGFLSRPVLKAAPYAVACPLTRDDQLFVARNVPLIGDSLIADYCFLTETFPYALRPDAKTAVIMHDLFSSRSRQFAAIGASDSVVTLTEAEECASLAKAGMIVAIQKDEAEFLRRQSRPAISSLLQWRRRQWRRPNRAGESDCCSLAARLPRMSRD